MNPQRIPGCARIPALLIVVPILCAPDSARAGLYEVFAPASGVRTRPGLLYQFRYFDPDGTAPTEGAESLPRPAPALSLSFFDGLLQPILLVRTIYSTTLEDETSVETSDGRTIPVRSRSADPSLYGHREGFLLDSAEFGLKGRHRNSGLYWAIKAELIPREKDGNRSSDYLKDALMGWNLYPWMDIRVGRMKVPISQANMKPTEQGLLVFQPTLDLLVPKRQLGAQVTVGDPWQVLAVTGGIFNSTGLAVEQIRRSDQIAYTARAEVRLHRLLKALKSNPLDMEFTLGGSFAWVKEAFDPPTEHRWLGADMRFHLWLFTVEGECMFKDFYTSPPGDSSRRADRGWGWHLDLQVAVWPGILDLTGRVEAGDGDRAVRGSGTSLSIDETSKQKRLWVTGGVSLHLAEQVRLDLNWIHRREEEGLSFDNDMFVALLQVAL